MKKIAIVIALMLFVSPSIFALPPPPPTVTGISPNTGPIAGGTSVNITGTHFTGATAVTFGSTDASSFAVNSAAQITATTPAGSAGVVDVTVTTPFGTSATGASDQYTYVFTGNENSDGDGLPDWGEQGPDGNNPNYDGNRDGTPDWRQDNVISFHTYTQDLSQHYITLAVSSGQRIESLYVSRTFDTPPQEWVNFPYGFFSFTIAGLQTGGGTTVTIYLDGPPPQSYYKYGKTPDNQLDHWYEFSYDGQTGAEVVGNTVVLHFIDGKRGDHDLEENGRITDPGGPAEIESHAGLYFPYLVSSNDEKTEIGIISTKSYASTSTISYYGENGDLIKTAAIMLGAHGKATISSDNIPSNSASAIVSGDGDPVGYTRYVNAQGKRCAWSAGTSLQKSLSVPHTAVDANWSTAIGLFNPGDDAVEVTLTYESGASSNLTLNARSRKFLQLGEVESVVSISSTGYISAMEMFDSRASGGDVAAILLKELSLNALYVPSILYGSGEFTGIGLKSYYNGTVNISGHSATGATEEISFGTQPLGTQASQSRMAFNLSGILGNENLWAKISGVADFTTAAGTPVLHFQGLALYGKENTGKLGAVSLNALRFREGFIGIASAASETTLTLLNPNTAETAITVTGYNAAGEALASNTVRLAAGSNWTGTASDLLNGISVADMTHIKMVSDADLYGFEMISANDRIEMLPVMGTE